MASTQEKILFSAEQLTEISKSCDPWHTHGNVAYHGDKDRWENSFEDKMKEKLPQVDLPVTIGWTGYPNITCPINQCPQRGWCLDKAGRFTAFLDGYYFFRRYAAGGAIMYGRLGNAANNMMEEETANEFLSKC